MSQKISAIVNFTVEPKNFAKLQELAINTQSIFARQPGFISAKLYGGLERKNLVQVIEWETLQDSINCMLSKDWQSEAASQFMEFIASGNATMSPVNYQVVYDSTHGTGS